MDDDKASIYNADMFDKIVANGSYDIAKADDDHEEAVIPDCIFLFFDKQEHVIEFEKSEIDFQLEKKGNNNDDKTDTCTIATMMLDQSSSYDDYEEGNENDDMLIIKVQDLSSMTSSVINDDDEDNEDNDDYDSCLSMIDNLKEQFEFDLLELNRDISFQFECNNTKESIISSTETTVTRTTTTNCETPITTIITDEVEDDIDIESDTHDNNEQYTAIELQDYYYWPQQQYYHHPCKRTETVEECDGGALPPKQPMRKKNEDEHNTTVPKKQQRIIGISNDINVIASNCKNEQQPIKLSRQQYIHVLENNNICILTY